jgi:hypothetical protein
MFRLIRITKQISFNRYPNFDSRLSKKCKGYFISNLVMAYQKWSDNQQRNEKLTHEIIILKK